MDDDIPQLISLADQSAIKKQKERETKDISIDSGSIQALSRGLSGVSEAPGTSYPASMRLHLSYIFPFSPSHLSQRRRRKNGWILFLGSGCATGSAETWTGYLSFFRAIPRNRERGNSNRVNNETYLLRVKCQELKCKCNNSVEMECSLQPSWIAKDGRCHSRNCWNPAKYNVGMKNQN